MSEYTQVWTPTRAKQVYDHLKKEKGLNPAALSLEWFQWAVKTELGQLGVYVQCGLPEPDDYESIAVAVVLAKEGLLPGYYISRKAFEDKLICELRSME
jgi:hypothetical protein